MFGKKFKPSKLEKALYDQAAKDALSGNVQMAYLENSEYVLAMTYFDKKWAKQGEP